MPKWLETGFKEYEKRIKGQCQLIEIQSNIPKRLECFLKDDFHDIKLDAHGIMFSSDELAAKIKNWQIQSVNVNFYIGGADGHHTCVQNGCKESWSLSKNTYPHHLVKVMLIEQIYRSIMILKNHPYHK